MSIGLWDGDLMSIGQVPFNLELMKISAYYKMKREIVVMSPRLEPSRYQKFFIRKDWDDGNYPIQFFEPNCTYGGRAFSPMKYKPLAPEIEAMEPDKYIYDSFSNSFNKPFFIMQTNGLHLRLESGFREIDSINAQSVIFHDYDLNSINGSYEYVKDLLSKRTVVYLQTKFPICVSNVEDLSKWTELDIGSLTTIKIDGIMNTEMLEYLKQIPKRKMNPIVYDVGKSFVNTQDFVTNKLPTIFHHISILRKFNPKNLLIFDSTLFENEELATMLNMMNDYARPINTQNQSYNTIGSDQTLVPFAMYIKQKFQVARKKPTEYTLDEARAAFQFIRERNYELFKQFYENDWRDFV